MKLLACLATLLVAIVFGHLLQKAIERIPHHTTGDETPLPPLPGVEDALWLVCDTPECAHLETPHHRVGDGLVACCWCIRLSPEPTTKDGAL